LSQPLERLQLLALEPLEQRVQQLALLEQLLLLQVSLFCFSSLPFLPELLRLSFESLLMPSYLQRPPPQ
jgi:hypothetical protein